MTNRDKLALYRQAKEAGLDPIEAAMITVAADTAELEREERIRRLSNEVCTGPVVEWSCFNHDPVPCSKCGADKCEACGDKCWCAALGR